MSESFENLVNGVTESIRRYVLPHVEDDFARGQLFAILFTLGSIKGNSDWKVAPLLHQVRIQDEAFADVLRLAEGMTFPELPKLPRAPAEFVEAAHIESLRDKGDRLIAELLVWLSEKQQGADPERSKVIERRLRSASRDQLKVEIDSIPKSMFEEISTGVERVEP